MIQSLNPQLINSSYGLTITKITEKHYPVLYRSKLGVWYKDMIVINLLCITNFELLIILNQLSVYNIFLNDILYYFESCQITKIWKLKKINIIEEKNILLLLYGREVVIKKIMGNIRKTVNKKIYFYLYINLKNVNLNYLTMPEYIKLFFTNSTHQSSYTYFSNWDLDN